MEFIGCKSYERRNKAQKDGKQGDVLQGLEMVSRCFLMGDMGNHGQSSSLQ